MVLSDVATESVWDPRGPHISGLAGRWAGGQRAEAGEDEVRRPVTDDGRCSGGGGGDDDDAGARGPPPMVTVDTATAAPLLSRRAPCPRCSSPWWAQATSPSASPSRGLSPPEAGGIRWGNGGEGLPPMAMGDTTMAASLLSPSPTCGARTRRAATATARPRAGSARAPDVVLVPCPQLLRGGLHLRRGRVIGDDRVSGRRCLPFPPPLPPRRRDR
uniref:Uncharacterized protein n=1 Tax=Oryza glumipatula TaxID=40148 RepID=A0A0E0ANA3_9ORYZ